MQFSKCCHTWKNVPQPTKRYEFPCRKNLGIGFSVVIAHRNIRLFTYDFPTTIIPRWKSEIPTKQNGSFLKNWCNCASVLFRGPSFFPFDWTGMGAIRSLFHNTGLGRRNQVAGRSFWWQQIASGSLHFVSLRVHLRLSFFIEPCYWPPNCLEFETFIVETTQTANHWRRLTESQSSRRKRTRSSKLIGKTLWSNQIQSYSGCWFFFVFILCISPMSSMSPTPDTLVTSSFGDTWLVGHDANNRCWS